MRALWVDDALEYDFPDLASFIRFLARLREDLFLGVVRRLSLSEGGRRVLSDNYWARRGNNSSFDDLTDGIEIHDLLLLTGEWESQSISTSDALEIVSSVNLVPDFLDRYDDGAHPIFVDVTMPFNERDHGPFITRLLGFVDGSADYPLRCESHFAGIYTLLYVYQRLRERGLVDDTILCRVSLVTKNVSQIPSLIELVFAEGRYLSLHHLRYDASDFLGRVSVTEKI